MAPTSMTTFATRRLAWSRSPSVAGTLATFRGSPTTGMTMLRSVGRKAGTGITSVRIPITMAVTGDEKMRRKHNVDDERDIVEDGETVRVPLALRDAMQREVFAHFHADNHRPHFVTSNDAAALDARREA